MTIVELVRNCGPVRLIVNSGDGTAMFDIDRCRSARVIDGRRMPTDHFQYMRFLASSLAEQAPIYALQIARRFAGDLFCCR